MTHAPRRSLSRTRASIAAVSVLLTALAASSVTDAKASGAGSLHQFPLAGANHFPTSVTNGSDGAVWFADRGAIGRVTTAGAVTDFPLPPNVAPGRMTTGPDGNLWFVDPGIGSIGRLTTGGQLTEFLLSPPSCGGYGCIPTSNPFDIVSGPDGNLWFSEPGGEFPGGDFPGRLGRITTAGVFTVVRLPGGPAEGTAQSPSGITVGADGALWFTDPETNSIGRSTTQFGITEFKLPHGSPVDITTGADGALWLIASPGILLRMSTTGLVTAERAIPAGLNGLSLTEIVTGPGRTLWFCGYDLNLSGGVLWRATLGMQITRRNLPTYVEDDGISPGPGGIWLTAYQNQTGAAAIDWLMLA